MLKILKNNLELSYKIKLLHTQLSYDSTPQDIVTKKRQDTGGKKKKTYEVIYLWILNEGQFITTKTGKKLNSHHLDYG